MPADPPDSARRPVAANDNGDAPTLDPEALHKIDDVVLQIARLIGRRMARRDFAARIAVAANDNTPKSTNESDGEADRE
ncbi:MAG: hypothetical protein PGN25_03460 [Methylorubrum populi]